MDFTASQRRAIETIDRHLQIIACAGSGKTGVVSARIAHILKTKPDLKPENIVAFTYTEKAAGELKTRIYRSIAENVGQLNGLAELYVGTIHSFCYKILQDYVPDYQKYEVLDAVKTKIFIDKNYREIGMTDLDMQAFKDTRYFIDLMNILRESELTGEIPEKYNTALRKYEEVFARHCYFDFTMIMEKAIRHLTEDSALRKKIAERVRFLTVDEYQDVNPIQEKLVRLFYDLGANVCVVGDDDQTIYQWRGSDVRAIQQFRSRYSDVASVTLEENFRSTEAVVGLARQVISNNQERLAKKMQHRGSYRYDPGDLAYAEFPTPEEENEFIAERILDLKESGLRYSDMVILVRVHSLSPDLIRVLNEQEIPFVVEGVNELMQTRDAQAAASLFYFLGGHQTADSVRAQWRALKHPPTEGNIAEALEYIKKMAAALPHKKYFSDLILQEVYHTFFDLLDLKEAEGSESKDLELLLYNLGKFSQVIQDFEYIYFRVSPKNKIKYFCNFLTYVANDYYPEGHLQNPYIRPDAVRIMTVHQAKGLEFPAVFIPGMSKNKFPHQAIGGKSVWHFFDRQYVKDHERYRSGQIEDERRLFYVAATRAKKYLFLTRAVYNRNSRPRSTFIEEGLHTEYLYQYSPQTDYQRPLFSSEGSATNEIDLNFSILEDYYHCPYLFKLSFFYGFCMPIGIRMGYGRALHNMVMDVHKRYLDGSLVPEELQSIVDLHFHLPYATSPVETKARASASESMDTYYKKNEEQFPNIEYVEKDIEIDFGNGVRVNGRIDLVKSKQEGQVRTGIIDFKTALPENKRPKTEEQLKIYAIGYEKLTGGIPDYLEIYDLGVNKTDHRQLLHRADLEATKNLILEAADNIRGNNLPKKCATHKCSTCLMRSICLTKKEKAKLRNVQEAEKAETVGSH